MLMTRIVQQTVEWHLLCIVGIVCLQKMEFLVYAYSSGDTGVSMDRVGVCVCVCWMQ
jgi:hypothetical protein